MGKWDKIKKWFCTHWGCVIAAMLIFLGWYIAFTSVGRAADIASWTSIILAVVVIVFMIIQHAMFDTKMDKIEDRLITDIPHIMERIHEKLKTEILAEIVYGMAAEPKLEGKPVEPYQVSFDKLKLMAPTGLLCLYCYAKSHEEGKSFVVWNLFEQIDTRVGWGRERRIFSVGCMFAITDILLVLLPAGTIWRAGGPIGDVQLQLVRPLPNTTCEAIKTEMMSRTNMDPKVDSLVGAIPTVDNYFAAQ